MKKKIIAASLWVALMPGLMQVAQAEKESLQLGIDLNNVEALSGIFSGAVPTEEVIALETARELNSPIASPEVNLISEESPVVEALSQPILVNVDELAGKERDSEQESLTLVSSTLVLDTVESQDNGAVMTAAEVLGDQGDEEAIILENFQRFTMPLQAVDYGQRAEYWGSKAPAYSDAYIYQSRVAAKDLQQFEVSLADKIAKGEIKNDLLVTDRGLTAKGEAIYTILLESEGEGLNPAHYHVGRINNLLRAQSSSMNADELNQLLQDGALSYIRDMTMGRPEIKRKDRDWLLEGRKVDVVQTLLEALQSSDPRVSLQAIAPQYPEYQNHKRALAAFKSREAELEPVIVPKGSTIKPGMSGDRVIMMRDRLNYLGYEAGDSTLYDQRMGDAVKAFQRTHLLEPDGAAGTKTITELNRSNDERVQQIQINMERWRWMPETMGDHYVMVDIPGFRYSVMKDGREAISARTVVGREGRKTPVFMSPMSYIVFSPYWHVPRSMAVKDFLPRLKKDPYALTRSKIRVFSGGKEVDPGTIDWSLYSANKFPFQLRQDPGDHNSLGRVKFMFPNDHAIYLHDTPSKSLFNRTSRDFSSGCVRIENPEELAEYFLGEKGWDQNKIKSAFKRTSEAHVSLNQDKKIPVYTLYMTTRVEGDSISFRADIYNKDKVLIEALQSLNK